MSNVFVRNLAAQAAMHPDIEQAVVTALRTTLPRVIESILREEYAGQRMYVAKIDSDCRKERARLVRSAFTGNNHAELAVRFNMSERQVRRIVRK